jgi:hypothetical protein
VAGAAGLEPVLDLLRFQVNTAIIGDSELFQTSADEGLYIEMKVESLEMFGSRVPGVLNFFSIGHLLFKPM